MSGNPRGPLLMLASACLLPPLLLLFLISCQSRQDSGNRSEGGPPSNDPAAEDSGPDGTSVWEHAKLSGVDFRGTGNEPGWFIEIRSDLEAREGKRIRFVSDYGQREAILHAPDPELEPRLRRAVYRGENGDLHIVVEIEGNACRDSMSGEEFESTVTVEFLGRTYSGCGRALH
jgi:uncharacterized membrane protein